MACCIFGRFHFQPNFISQLQCSSTGSLARRIRVREPFFRRWVKGNLMISGQSKIQFMTHSHRAFQCGWGIRPLRRTALVGSMGTTTQFGDFLWALL